MENIIGFLVTIIIALISYLVLMRKKKVSNIKQYLGRLDEPNEMIGKYSISGRKREVTEYSKYTKFFIHLIGDEGMDYLSSIFKINYTVMDNKIKLLKMEKKISVDDIIVLKVLGTIITFAIVLLSIYTTQPAYIFIAFYVFILLFLYPSVKISDLLKARRKAIENELPDWTDSLLIAVDSGHTLPEAVNRVVMKKSGYLSDEFIYVETIVKNDSIKWEYALEEMADRNNIPMLTDLINNIITAHTRGTAIADTLKQESRQLRELKCLKIEEAHKMSIKILPFILIFCFLPFFILLLAPAFAKIMGI